MATDNSSSKHRVKAFRTRLTDQFKRVETYVTEQEKEQIEEVKAELGVTSDVAVAGLLRMGLAQYRTERSQSASHAQNSGRSLSAAGLISCSADQAFRSISVAQASSNSLKTQEESVVHATWESNDGQASVRGVSTGISAKNANDTLSSASQLPSLSQETNDNPISRFFKTRKELRNE